MIDRRQVLIALAALSAAGPAAAAAVEPEAARPIGQAYRAVHPDFDARKAAAELAPGDWSPAALKRLQTRVAADHRAARVFIHRGWRLSDTEGRLFALLA
jgi:hypothetical protein